MAVMKDSPKTRQRHARGGERDDVWAPPYEHDNQRAPHMNTKRRAPALRVWVTAFASEAADAIRLL